MKSFFKLFTLCASIVIFISACGNKKNDAGDTSVKYTPDDSVLYNAIVHMDSVYFNAYNTCDIATQAAIYDDSIEFYHDKGGLSTSKTDLLKALKENICGKVTRELVPGSIEVYSIKGYGAVEMGQHKFHNNQEKSDTPSHIGKFVLIWQLKNNEWKIKRVISLH